MRTFLAGGDLVLADRIVSGGTLVVDGDRIVDVVGGAARGASHDRQVDVTGRLIVPGFIDGHVHGAAGHDVLDGAGGVAAVAAVLPRWGVTAFSPTSMACSAERLEAFLAEVARLRSQAHHPGARILPAHLESNFINPEYRGAQPLEHIRPANFGAHPAPSTQHPAPTPSTEHSAPSTFSASDILSVIDRHAPDVGVVTMAPEIEGGVALLRRLVAAGIQISLGHSGATFEQAQEAIAAGARRATHLFNAMSPMAHRRPGLAGAVLAADEIAAEIICDGHHVHPAVVRVAIEAKGASRVLAISDGTAGSGLPAGSRANLGGRSVTVSDVARLDDGTMAGSVASMDRVLARLVSSVGLDLVRAVELCSTTPARELGLQGHGVLVAGAVADFVILSASFAVLETWIGGRRVFGSGTGH